MNNTFNTKSKIETIKCLLLGENGSGKTSFLQTLASGEFPVDFIRSIYQQCSFYVEPKSLNLNQLNTNDNGITIEICDSDVTVENLLSQVNLTNYQVILLCFALDNKSTLETVQKKWLKELKNFDKNYQLPYLLVGLKSDTLASGENGDENGECSGSGNHNNTLAASTVKLHQMDDNTTKRSKRTRRTTEQFYRDYAKKLGAYDYLEFSAKNGIPNDEFLFAKICESYYLGNKQATTRKLFNASNRYQRLKSNNSTHGDAQLTLNTQQQQQQQQQQQPQLIQPQQLNKSETIKFKVRTFISRCGRYLFSCASASQEATQKFKRNTQERFSKRPKINKKAHTLLTAGVSTLTVNDENDNDEVFFS